MLADEVGVGKTLSLAASAMVSALLDDGPVLILCPSTLTLQWQVELKDKLGIPSAVWLSTKKVWLDHQGHTIKTRGPEDIVRCPFRIAIVSTGLIFHHSEEQRFLLERKFGTVVLDEAHKARRRGGLGDRKKAEPNNLLDFMLHIGPRTKNLLLGTATPIQTEVSELWDLMRILNAGGDFVLGRETLSKWVDWQKALPVVKGDETPADERDAWEWLRNPLPPGEEDPNFASLRLQLGIPDNAFFTDRGFGSLGFFEQQAVGETLAPAFYREHNPFVRHTDSPPSPDPGRSRPAGEGRSGHPPEPQRPTGCLSGREFRGLGFAHQSPLRSGLQGCRGLHRRFAAAHEGRRIHEDDAASTHLFKFCLGQSHRREDAARRDAGR